jgi:hypothetical protein
MAADDQIHTRFYESARAEIIQRIVARDQALLAYAVAAGGYLAFLVDKFSLYRDFKAGASCSAVEMTLPLSLLCILFSFVVCQHHIVIGALARYLTHEWPRNIANSGGQPLIQWDGSQSFFEMHGISQSLRSIAQGLAFATPFLFELKLFFSEGKELWCLCGWTAYISVFVAISAAFVVIAVHIKAYMFRKKQ